MYRFLSSFCLLLLSFSITLKARVTERPRLVVGIVADQMRWDYLYRFYDRYGDGGFKRLLKDGFSCEKAFINYIPSYTAPGHSCIYTGSVPSVHGIAGNDWIDNITGKHWYCTEDSSVLPVGGSRKAGMMSPRNLLASTITDELRLATNFRSKVFGISLKDRGAILPAGHLANAAFWFDDSTGNFISSSYYMKRLPRWMEEFNSERHPDRMLKKAWTTLYPLNTYTQSLPDDNPYEGSFKEEARPVFPHLKNLKRDYGNIRKTPAGNSYTLMAAAACIHAENLGGNESTDFLCISLSATDYIGHQFAPNSIEVEDTYLRLDQELESFLKYLDEKLGKENYLLFLTADHGGAHNAAFLQDRNMPAGNENEYKLAADLKSFLKKELKKENLIRGMENYQVFLDNEGIKASGIQREAVKEKIKDWFLQKPEVAYVIDLENPDKAAVPQLIRQKAINGYNRLRSGSLLIINNPGWYYGYAETGTTHGTWHPYDAHIPLLWYGWNIRPGKTNKTVHMEDISATLAALLKIQMPNGCIGKVITGIAE